MSPFPEKSDLLVTGPRIIWLSQGLPFHPKQTSHCNLGYLTGGYLGNTHSKHPRRCDELLPCTHFTNMISVMPREQERCNWEGSPTSVSSSVKQSNNWPLKLYGEMSQQTKNSTWILVTGHQATTWFVPGARVGVLPEVEGTSKHAL